ncbi:hypothetical protein LJB90_02040 [Eubacteriales bacterium OttesenSCG-928-G02]|nr:hypothetical protein [Eubacteriales bacterium OttesenSCG-928-G02]
MNKKHFIRFLCFFIILVFTLQLAVFAEPGSSAESESSEIKDPYIEPTITSNGLIVIKCVQNGQILFNTANGKSVSPTVSAKLVAAMVAYDMLPSLDERIEVKSEALKGIGSIGDISAPMLNLTPGNAFTARQLLLATLVSAANDACNSLAYHLSDGNLSLFVEKMNQKAAEIGCLNTKFTNAVGLDDVGSFTTVEDVAAIAATFFKYNTLLELASQPSYQIGNATIHTKNYLLSESLYKGATIKKAMGMIAGQRSSQADYCLITAAEEGGLGYVYVIMNAAGEIRNTDGTREFPAENAYNDMKKIFDWAKTSFGYVTLLEEGKVVGELPVSLGADSFDHVNYVAEEKLEILFPKGLSKDEITSEKLLTLEQLTAPVQKGTVVGEIRYYHNGAEIAKTNLITAVGVEKSSLLALGSQLKAFLYGSTMKTIIKVFIVLILLYILFIITVNIIKLVLKTKARAEKSARIKARQEKYRKQSQKKLSDANENSPKAENTDENIDENETEN